MPMFALLTDRREKYQITNDDCCCCAAAVYFLVEHITSHERAIFTKQCTLALRVTDNSPDNQLPDKNAFLGG